MRQDRCLEEGQRQHLREHARADAEAIEEFPALSELRNAFAKIHTSQAPSVAAAKAQVTAAVHETIKELLDEIDGERAELNQKIDAPQAIDTLRRRVETGALTGCH